jgi:ionotropic glutamate receptor NMDA 2B
MDDIIWPGNALKHPSGRPIKFHLKIVTLVRKLNSLFICSKNLFEKFKEEPPFVIYKTPTNNECIQNSVKVRVINRTNEGYLLCLVLIISILKPYLIRNSSIAPTYYDQCASGFYIDLLLMLKNTLDFTFEMYEVEDGRWGAKIGSIWNGLIGDLLKGKADMVMTSLKITHERSQAVDFSVPFMETGIAIVVSLRPGAISTTAFLSKSFLK